MEPGRRVKGTVREGKIVRRASESTGPCPESACTRRQTGGSTHQQSVADTGGHRPGGTAADTSGQRHRESGRRPESTVREDKNVVKRQASESTGSRPKSACTKRQVGGSTYQQSEADTRGHRPGGIAASMEEQEPTTSSA